MPRLNLHLQTDSPIDLGAINFNESLLAQRPSLRTKAQQLAFKCLLANVWKYRKQPLLFNLRNQRNFPDRYNPFAIGNKPLVAVIKQLRANGLVKVIKGIPHYAKSEAGDYCDPHLSTLVASDQLIEIAYAAIEPQKLIQKKQDHIQFKDNEGRLIDYVSTDYTRSTEEMMSVYCDYMSQQRVMVEGQKLEAFFLFRINKNWGGDGSLFYGGRSSHPFMNLKKEKRADITLNGKSTVSLDYSASVANLLYLMMTGQRLYPDGDPYEVDGLERRVVKQYFSIMTNTRSARGAEMGVINWLAKKNVKTEEKAPVIAAEKSFGSKQAIIKAIVGRNLPIASCLMQGKAMGQHYQWLEANQVFHVAHQLSLMGVPALTVHDEFIVREEDKEIAEMVMYSTWPSDLPSLTEAPWYKCHEPQPEAL